MKNNLNVDLQSQIISGENIHINFEIDNYKKLCLLNGWDDIDLTLKNEKSILDFENTNLKKWLKPQHQL